jgi:hypothetical protein
LNYQLQQQTVTRKEVAFKTMLHTFEELLNNNKKLDDSTVKLWRKFLCTDRDYPERYFIRAVELAGEMKFMPKISEIIERFDDYSRRDEMERPKLPPPRDYHKETAKKWMAQIRTIISYGGQLRPDFNWRLLGKLYEPDELKKLLDRNLKERSAF